MGRPAYRTLPVRAVLNLLRQWCCVGCSASISLAPSHPRTPTIGLSSGIACHHGASFEDLQRGLRGTILAHALRAKHLRAYLQESIAIGVVRSNLTPNGIRYHLASDAPLGNPVSNDGGTVSPSSTVIARAKRRRRPLNDVVHTAPSFARWAVDYFRPSGKCLDPCRGGSAFYDALLGRAARQRDCFADWCEVDEGRDFFGYQEPCDWIITNPPWSCYRAISRHAFQLAANVVFLVRLHNVLGTSARHRDYLQHGHALKEIVVVDWKDAGLPPEGFTLALFHWQRGYTGECRWSYPTQVSKDESLVAVVSA